MELDEKKEVIKSVQEEAERLIKNHPARPTIEVRPFVCAQHYNRHWMWLQQLYIQRLAQISQSRALLSLLQAYRAAMQTQWSWILQLCSCVEQHLKENTLYFEVCAQHFPLFQQILTLTSVVVLFYIRLYVFVAPSSFSATPKNPWTTLRTCEIPFRGSTAATRPAACTDWRISSRSPW